GEGSSSHEHVIDNLDYLFGVTSNNSLARNNNRRYHIARHRNVLVISHIQLHIPDRPIATVRNVSAQLTVP
ncbi:MAG TPA: hypothetical protein VK636_16640, partial [Gemmatimonadaceae bacterium]|nr:hypothetical protein [Gemmatimonadaceae bacterium]